MKKRLAMVLSAVLIALILVSVFLILQSYSLTEKPFYVGVTYCGNSVDEAKQLIDKVKTYTNIFVLQSGPLQENQSATVEICDYAVNNDLDLIVYFGSLDWKHNVVSGFLNATTNRWGNHFLGLYYGDELGGNMLDDPPTLSEFRGDHTSVSFLPSGEIRTYETNTYVMGVNYTDSSEHYNVIKTHYPNGTITVEHSPPADAVIYQPDGTTTLRKPDGSISIVTGYGSISQFQSYQQLWDTRPLKNYKDAANYFVEKRLDATNWLHNESSSVKAFTSDYGLYWFDYLGGYDVVLAEFGWNHTETQHMGLVRGAASLQGKSWGTMLTWKFDHAPYMASGTELYDQMTLAYNGGAEYVVVFNYAPDGDGFGLLQEEHFTALQRFWTEHVEPNGEKAKVMNVEAVLVLPADYGWGMRNPEDTIWGLWQADDKSLQVWGSLQNALEVYGEKLDIVYDDPAFPVSGYRTVLWWNNNG
ncbi:MAG: hypothetical protein ACFCUE_04115 [Candidatus Bathyarchaeia archaeon]|jgi:hypothetical protein